MPIAEANAQIRVDALPTIDADPVQMWQLLQNLISNALKFHQLGNSPDIHIHIAATLFEEDHRSWCQISVHDNGIGFDEK